MISNYTSTCYLLIRCNRCYFKKSFPQWSSVIHITVESNLKGVAFHLQGREHSQNNSLIDQSDTKHLPDKTLQGFKPFHFKLILRWDFLKDIYLVFTVYPCVTYHSRQPSEVVISHISIL